MKDCSDDELERPCRAALSPDPFCCFIEIRLKKAL